MQKTHACDEKRTRVFFIARAFFRMQFLFLKRYASRWNNSFRNSGLLPTFISNIIKMIKKCS